MSRPKKPLPTFGAAATWAEFGDFGVCHHPRRVEREAVVHVRVFVDLVDVGRRLAFAFVLRSQRCFDRNEGSDFLQ